jgi:UDP-glucose 4-epimerase
MNVLITGGAGFIGSHLAASLQHRARVRILDNFRTGHPDNLKGVSADLIEGDICDAATVASAMQDIDYVFHMAAFVSVPESMAHPAACERINGAGLVNVLETAAKAGVRKAFFPSSAAVYGNNPAVPKTEEMLPEPLSPYAVTKLAGEGWCRYYHQSGRLPTVALRFFNVFGPRQDPNGPYAAAVPIFIGNARENKPLTIFGDGSQTRDFIHVADICDAITHVTTHPDTHGVYNAGYGKAITVLALARTILQLTGSDSPIVHLPERPGDVRHSLASIDRLTSTGFSPAGSLASGLAATIASFPQ